MLAVAVRREARERNGGAIAVSVPGRSSAGTCRRVVHRSRVQRITELFVRVRRHHLLGLVRTGANAKKQGKMDNDPVAIALIRQEAPRLHA